MRTIRQWLAFLSYKAAPKKPAPTDWMEVARDLARADVERIRKETERKAG